MRTRAAGRSDVVTARRFSARGVAAVAATALGLALLAGASAAPLPYHSAATARLRLSWSARPERIEVCRTLSAEELRERPEHMRQRVECEGSFATYALRVELDARVVGDVVVHGGGFRRDRPLYLLREFPVSAGPHRVRITFTRRERTDDDAAAFAPAVVPAADTGLYAGRAQREAAEHARRAHAAIPPRLALDTSLVFAPRSVALIGFDAERKVLLVQSDRPRP